MTEGPGRGKRVDLPKTTGTKTMFPAMIKQADIQGKPARWAPSKKAKGRTPKTKSKT
jgi:hypothetical protein